MQLEQYFDFLAPDDIRIKGHRIGIESVLYEYLFHEQTPEQILRRFPSLALEQIYTTITAACLCDREKVEAYVKDWLEWGERMRAEQDRNPPPVVVRFRTLKTQQQRTGIQASTRCVFCWMKTLTRSIVRICCDANRRWLSRGSGDISAPPDSTLDYRDSDLVRSSTLLSW